MISINVTSTIFLNDLPVWLNAGKIYTKIEPSTARNVFTTAFLILNILIAVVGEYFLKRRNQRRLILRKGPDAKSVPFPLLTPWLSLANLVTYFWKTRTLPGGLLGLLMLATGAFGLIQHYMVNSFILPVQLPTWCDFQAGIVTTANNIEVAPSPAWPAALLAFGAHIAVTTTGGKIGIYDKINFNIATFQPTTADILGSWNCSQSPDSTIQPSDWADLSSLQQYLDAQSFLSPETQSISGAFDFNNTGSYLGFLAWSGTFSGNDSSWEVRTTIANDLNSTSPKIASNLNCYLVKDVANWNPTPMPSNETLSAWVDIMFGFISEVPASHYPTQVESVLNAMSMLAGSGNQKNRELPAGANPQYGCVMEGSEIHVAVYFTLLLLFFILFTLLIADLYQLARYRLNKRQGLVKEIPTDLISWQLNMLRRMTRNKELQTKDLRKYSYKYSDVTEDFEFMETAIASADFPVIQKSENN